MKQYVRHKSGQGPLYEVGLDKGSQVVAKEVGDVDNEYYSLPAKEYAPCDPPEEWEDITYRCEVSPTGFLTCGGEPLDHVNSQFTKVRCRKVPGVNNPDWAFIIKRKKQ